jgi:hypothetical protein
MEEESSDQDAVAQPSISGISGCGSLGCSTLFVLGFFGLPLLHMRGGTWEGGEMMLLPMLIGAPSFLIGNIFAFFAVSSKSESENTMGFIALFLLWGLISLGCILAVIFGSFS